MSDSFSRIRSSQRGALRRPGELIGDHVPLARHARSHAATNKAVCSVAPFL
jgi:hypothetical protein